MPKFSKRDRKEEAICPSCGEWKTTDFTPEELQEKEWECSDCANKRLVDPENHPENRGARKITPYDPEFEFLTKLITLVTKQGVPVEAIKTITDKYRPLTTVDQAGDLAAEIWTMVTTTYGIPREWLIKKLPESKRTASKKTANDDLTQFALDDKQIRNHFKSRGTSVEDVLKSLPNFSIEYINKVQENKDPSLKDNTRGFYDFNTGTLYINPRMRVDDKRLTIIHEIEHAIQDSVGQLPVHTPEELHEVKKVPYLDRTFEWGARQQQFNALKARGLSLEEIEAFTFKRNVRTESMSEWEIGAAKEAIHNEVEQMNEIYEQMMPESIMAKKADAYNNPQEQWPAQEQAEDFSDRPVNSYAYEPEKVSSTPEQDKKTLMSIAWDLVVERFFGAHARWSDVIKELKDMYPALQDEDIAQLRNQVKHSLDVQTNNIESKPKKALEIPMSGDAGNPDAGTGFYDTPGGADLGKRPEGDFPSSSWMPSGTADMDAEYWDNIDSALSKKELNKKSSLIKIASNDFVAQVDVDGVFLKDLFGEEVSFEQPTNIRWSLEFEMREWGVKGAYVHVPDQEVVIIYQTDTVSDVNPDGGYEDRSRKVVLQNVKIEGVDHATWDSILTPRTLSFDGKGWVVDFGNYITSGLSKKEINKKANPDTRYWIAPDGQAFPVSGIHPIWIQNNAAILKKYGINPKQATYEIHEQMINSGWSRISTEKSGFQIEIQDLSKLPGYLDDFIAKHFQQGDEILIGNGKQPGVFISDPFPSIQRAVNKQLVGTRRAFLKQADLNGKTVNDILMQIESTGGATYNMSRGDLTGQEMFAVSIYPERERTEEIATFDDIENYIEANMDLLRDSGNSFGAWAHDGKVYFDVIATIPDQKQALDLGRKHNQLAIYDLKNKVEIPTGVKRASLKKIAIDRQDVVDFYLLSLIPMEALAEEGTDQHYNGLSIFNGIVERLRNEYIEKGMAELRDEAETTQWVKRIPSHDMPEELKPYYTYHESGYGGDDYGDGGSGRFPFQCSSCNDGLGEDDVYQFDDNVYCESCESDAIENALREYVQYCEDCHKFVADTMADELEPYVPSGKIDNLREHKGHRLVGLAQGHEIYQEVKDNLAKQLKIRFPRPEKKQEPPTSAAFPEASLKIAGEGRYLGDGSYWEAPDNFDSYKPADFYTVFEHAPWKTNYGGPLWAEVAKTIGKMLQTTDLSSLIVLIDHFHDLAHNTGKLLDKFDEWYWLKPLLDLKAKPGSLRQLLQMGSRPVRTLVTEYYRMHGKPDAMAAAIREVPFRLSKKAEDASPLTQEDQDQIASTSSPVYNIAINNFYEAAKRGHSKDRSLAYAVDSVKNLEQIDPKKLTELINTYLTGLI